MALLPITGLEDHTAGTTNNNGIINANWARMEEIFDPTTTGALLNIFAKALIRSATLPSADAVLVWDPATGKPAFRPSGATLAYAGSVALSFVGASVQRLALTGDVTLTFSGLAASRRIVLAISSDASTRALTWPVGARWLGTALTSLPASKAARVELLSTGTTDAEVWLSAMVEP